MVFASIDFLGMQCRRTFRGNRKSAESDNGFLDRSSDSSQSTPRDKIMSSSKMFSPPQSRMKLDHRLDHRLRVSENSSHHGSVSGSSNCSGPSSFRSSNSSSDNLEFSGSSRSSNSSQTQVSPIQQELVHRACSIFFFKLLFENSF